MLKQLYASDMYRPDQHSFMLYPGPTVARGWWFGLVVFFLAWKERLTMAKETDLFIVT